MVAEVKSSNGISLVPIETRLMARRKLFIEGQINQETACTFIRQLLLLAGENSTKNIDILINSPGGELNAGLLMYDAIRSCPAPVRMFCVGRAYSMAAVLFASGSHGRYMLPHSELMLHEPLILNQVSGSCSSIKAISDTLQNSKKKLDQILAYHTGKSVEEIEKETNYDHYFNPEESMEFGLCDKVIGFHEMIGEE